MHSSHIPAALSTLARFAWRVGLWLLACGLAGPVCLASAEASPEYALKAAFVYNFAKFTDWPKNSLDGPLTLCVFGTDPYGEALDGLEGRSVQNHPLAIVRDVGPARAATCQLLLVGNIGEERRAAILARLADRPVLTISDNAGFVGTGGMIELAMVNNRIQFEVNLDAVRSARLQISAQLLKLARHVKGAP